MTTTTTTKLSDVVDALDVLGRLSLDALIELASGGLPGDLPGGAADVLAALVVLPEPSVEGCPELFVRIDGQVVLVGYDENGRAFAQPWSYVDAGPAGELWRDSAGDHRVFAV